MTGAIEFLRKAKAICDSRDTCTNCPVDDLCLCGVNNWDDDAADLVRKVMEYRLRRYQMQREIKFRGKRLDNGEWAYGAFVPDALEQTHGKMVTLGFIRRYRPNQTVESVEMIEVDRNTVGQFTGLKDKNGKEIYEGDIVVFEDMTSTESGYWERDCIGIVVWGEETAAFEVTNRFSAKSIMLTSKESYEVLSDCEVIGDIYTTPELLEVTE